MSALLASLFGGSSAAEAPPAPEMQKVNVCDQSALKAALDTALLEWFTGGTAQPAEVAADGPVAAAATAAITASPKTPAGVAFALAASAKKQDLCLVTDEKWSTAKLVPGLLALLSVGFSLWWSWMTGNDPAQSSLTGWGVVGFFFFSTLMSFVALYVEPDALFLVDASSSRSAAEKMKKSGRRELALGLLSAGLQGASSSMMRHEYDYELKLFGKHNEFSSKKNVGEFFTQDGLFAEHKFKAYLRDCAVSFVSQRPQAE